MTHFIGSSTRFQVSEQFFNLNIIDSTINLRLTGFLNQVSSLYFVIESPKYFYHVNATDLGIDVVDNLFQLAKELSKLFSKGDELIQWAHNNVMCKQKLNNGVCKTVLEVVPNQDIAFLENGIMLPLRECLSGSYILDAVSEGQQL